AVYRDEWLAPLSAWARQRLGGFHRGFHDFVSMTVTDFQQRGPAVFAAVPVSSLQMRNLRGKMPEIAASPLLARLTALDLSEPRLAPDELRPLGASPHLGALRAFTMPYTCLSEKHAQALADWAILPRLRRLDLLLESSEAFSKLMTGAAAGRLSSLERF